jgi:hypothetical protein
LIKVRRVFLDRRMRFLLVCVAIVVVGVLQETWLIPHYFAVITPAFYAIGLQMIRHLRQWKPGRQPVGTAIQCFTIAVCIALATTRPSAEPLHLQIPRWPSAEWAAG